MFLVTGGLLKIYNTPGWILTIDYMTNDYFHGFFLIEKLLKIKYLLKKTYQKSRAPEQLRVVSGWQCNQSLKYGDDEERNN